MQTDRELTRIGSNVERCLASSFAKRATPGARLASSFAKHATPGARLACEADIQDVAASKVWLRRTSREADEGSPPPDFSALLATLARQALIAEAELTPKPGLVDRRGSGSHTDLSLALMKRSAFAIEPFIRRMAFQSTNERPSALLRTAVAATGRAAESAMLRVTNGTNTHRGAIWTLGLLTAAAAITGRDELPLVRSHNTRSSLNAAAIARTAGDLASFDDSYESAPNAERQTPNALLSHGHLVAEKFGVTGARGEAISGFPHIIEVGLPVLRARRGAGAPESIARLDALLSIIAHLDDTCLLYRGGKPALQATKQGAAAVVAAGGAGSETGRKHLYALDTRLLELGVSPGGSADLLAGTLFLDAIERHQTWVGSVGAASL
jgi:triphosphoribosyl-dephospho-CoA synthase